MGMHRVHTHEPAEPGKPGKLVLEHLGDSNYAITFEGNLPAWLTDQVQPGHLYGGGASFTRLEPDTDHKPLPAHLHHAPHHHEVVPPEPAPDPEPAATPAD